MNCSKVRLIICLTTRLVLVLACIGINPHVVRAAAKKTAVNPPTLTLKQLVHLVMPSMVRLTVLNKDGVPAVQGSGFVVGPDLIATNYHVVKGAHAVTANFDSGRSEQVIGIVGADENFDLVVLRANTAGVAQLHLRGSPLPLAALWTQEPETAAWILATNGVDPQLIQAMHDAGVVPPTVERASAISIGSLPEIADDVVAFGSPDGLSNSISTGIVSGIRANNSLKLIQTTCPISHGSSGGALVDMKGRVVGVTALMLTDGENLNFAYPSYYLRKILQEYPTGVVTWAEIEQCQKDLNTRLIGLWHYDVANDLHFDGLDKLKDVVNAGADVNVLNQYGEPIAASAASYGSADALQVLLNAGADPNGQNSVGTPILNYAAVFGSAACVNLLISRGADVNKKYGTNGSTTLMSAASVGTIDSVNALIAAGAQINVKDDDGETAIYHAAFRIDSGCLRSLVAAGANVDVQTNDGVTPLMWAAGHGRVDSVKMLITAGANINAVDNQGSTALLYAESGNHPDVVSALIAAGATMSTP